MDALCAQFAAAAHVWCPEENSTAVLRQLARTRALLAAGGTYDEVCAHAERVHAFYRYALRALGAETVHRDNPHLFYLLHRCLTRTDPHAVLRASAEADEYIVAAYVCG